ncbi:hypothetical protein DI005_17805 [Prauserella sp. PE36]|uniref:Uncharacterized protein n=1 Tax=Prauserella endophytica TaxID=1592324 RepID=A0ABY2S4N1_9PSEU|nr:MULTISPECIES: hypothetical protein [Prauserella]RBM18874.1 hypothetical protein DI005_17805 [Prauserella sp. PE36]TKG70604.1 hypothetical protein FCN18_17165 [Prauserella endophytica]
MLLGGLLALWPARSASRQAVVRRRRIAAVAPAWVLVLLGIAAVGGLAPRRGGQWAAFGVTAACALVAVVVIVLALGGRSCGRPRCVGEDAVGQVDGGQVPPEHPVEGDQVVIRLL